MSFIKDMPNPSAEQLASPEFEAIWRVIKNWDVNVPEFYQGYCGANGSHVVLILDVLPDTPLVRAVEALRKYGNHKGAGTDGGCCMWDDNCWCGYGVELAELEQAAGLAVSRPVQDARHG